MNLQVRVNIDQKSHKIHFGIQSWYDSSDVLILSYKLREKFWSNLRAYLRRVAVSESLVPAEPLELQIEVQDEEWVSKIDVGVSSIVPRLYTTLTQSDR